MSPFRHMVSGRQATGCLSLMLTVHVGHGGTLTHWLNERAPRRAFIICGKFPRTGTPDGPGGIDHLLFPLDHFKSIGFKT